MGGAAAGTITSANSSTMRGTAATKIARRHRNRRRLAGLWAATFAIAAGCAAAAQERRAIASSGAMALHIPAQSLVNALQAYGEETGVQVLYESRSAAGRRSTAVEGTFTPEQALRLLLRGTELQVRYARADAVTLELPHSDNELPPQGALAKVDLSLGTLRVRASRDDDKDELRDYSESVQIDVQKALKQNARTSNGSYRVVLDLWIDPSRTIERTRLYRSTGDADRDAAVAAAVRGITISRSAPENMPQPVRVAIVVRAAQ